VRRNAFVDYGIIAVVAIALALLIQGFVVKPYRIPSPSMNDTLLPGDRVLVNRLIFRFRDPQRGNIVVFTWPVNRKYVFIKRVIGVPGDTISLAAGHVLVNGRPISEPYVRRVNGAPVPTEPAPASPGTTMNEPWSLQRPYKVPAGDYFVMGDNRTLSDDSRDWGPVPAGDLIGQAFLIYWPIPRIRIL
jgi:signal peptidase I